MCGRYCITSAPEAIRALFRYREQPNFPPRYNVAPTQPVPIVRINNGRREYALVRWGLLPSWVKDPKAFTLLINARGESVLEKPAFRNAMKRRRCLFPADGFYEWKADGNRKVPFFARPVNDGPIAFAGLWETWIGPNGEEIETAAIVTTQANRTMGVVHHRAPVIVSAEAFDLWLDCANVDAATAAAMIAPAPEGLMAIHEISPAVNRVANDSPDLLTPVTAKELASADQLAPAAAAVDPPKAPGRQKRKADTGQGSLF